VLGASAEITWPWPLIFWPQNLIRSSWCTSDESLATIHEWILEISQKHKHIVSDGRTQRQRHAKHTSLVSGTRQRGLQNCLLMHLEANNHALHWQSTGLWKLLNPAQTMLSSRSCLYHLLPPRVHRSYSLRKRQHGYQLPHIEYNLYKTSFINRCLFNLRWLLWRNIESIPFYSIYGRINLQLEPMGFPV